MRGSAVVLVCGIGWGCGGGAASDASEPRVYVVDNITAVSPFETFSSEVAFLDLTGRQIPGTRVSDPGSDAGQYGMVYAIMPDGGSLTASAINIASPTSRRTDIWSIAGVKPGDRYVFDGNGISVNPPKLPADCVRRTITRFTLDATGTQASWNDADAASVDARMVHRSTGCPGGAPPINCIFTDQVDGSTATSVKVTTFGLPPSMDLISVDVIACPNEGYDDIRPLLTGRFDAVVGPPP